MLLAKTPRVSAGWNSTCDGWCGRSFRSFRSSAIDLVYVDDPGFLLSLGQDPQAAFEARTKHITDINKAKQRPMCGACTRRDRDAYGAPCVYSGSWPRLAAMMGHPRGIVHAAESQDDWSRFVGELEEADSAWCYLHPHAAGAPSASETGGLSAADMLEADASDEDEVEDVRASSRRWLR